MAGLKSLRAYGNKMTDAAFLEFRPYLRHLDLSGNPFEAFELPPGMAELESLSLRGTHLKQLEISHDLRSLRGLDVSFNQLTHLDLPFIAEESEPMVRIDVSSNQLERVSFPLGYSVEGIDLVGFPKNQVT